MSIPVNVEQLLRGQVVEQARIEYKEGWNPESIIHTLCAFANDINNLGGGYLVIGVKEENGTPVLPVTGLPKEKLDRYQKDLVQMCHRIDPVYAPVCQPVEFEGKHLLLIWAPGGYERPYRAPRILSKRETGKDYFIRRFSNTVRASQSEINELMSLGPNIPYDDRVNPAAQISDLRSSLMLDYLATVDSTLAISDKDTLSIAQDLRVVGGPVEDMHPRNVGLLFFSMQPEQHIRLAQIEVVNIPDPTGEGMEEKIFRGPLDRQLADALRYIRNTVVAEKIFKLPNQAEAVRVFNYPYAAIEEALTNAVYHKSYAIPEPVTVRIEQDRMAITSLPGPDRSISDEDIAQRHMISAKYRNRRIGDFLKELHLSEGRNTGVPTMLRALEHNGSTPPLFETDNDRSFFRVTFMAHPAFTRKGWKPMNDQGKHALQESSERAENSARKRKTVRESRKQCAKAENSARKQETVRENGKQCAKAARAGATKRNPKLCTRLRRGDYRSACYKNAS